MPEVLRGRLAAIRLATVLTAVEGELHTGRLALGDARIALHRGRVVGAEAGGLTGVDAVVEAFLTEAEQFVLDDDPVPAAPGLGDTLALVMEGCRVADDWARHRMTVFEARGAVPAAFARIDGRRSLERALQLAGAARAPAVALLDDLVTAGALVAIGVGTPAPAALDFDDALRRGREALKQGQLADAADWFAEALRLRPDDRAAGQNLRHVRTLLARQQPPAPRGDR